MADSGLTLPMELVPLSTLSGGRAHVTLVRRGAFAPPSAPGSLGRIERFEVLGLLGEGGMGLVYLARDPVSGAKVAVKVMKPEVSDDPRSAHRFLGEARHMGGLSHPHILRVLELSDRKEGPYYVMPCAEGGSLLGQYKSGVPLGEETVLRIARQVAQALSHAHKHGVIHRDIKPGNILLDGDGNALLTDFGLVHTVFNDSMVDASASHLEGTAPYMSPAVAHGEAEDTRCDIYAFGALLYELLAGQPPYAGRTPQIILDQILKGPPPPVRTVNPKASPALAKIAEGCMARELRDRYAAMSDVVADLERAINGKPPLGPHGRQHRPPRIAVLLGAVLGVVVLAIGAVCHWTTKKASASQTRAAFTPPLSPQAASLSVHAVERPLKDQRGIAKASAEKDADSATVNRHPNVKGGEADEGGQPTAAWAGTNGVKAVPVGDSPYLVIDLSGGTNATHYPVTYLSAVPAGGWTDEYKTDKLVLRRIEPGSFLMGSPSTELARDPSRETQHLVTITAPFYIGVFEITQRQWERVTGGRPSYFSDPSCYAARPVESVSYAMIFGCAPNSNDPTDGEAPAQSFMGRLRARTGLNIGLPSDAQWEYACRAGTATSFGNGRDLSAVDAPCPELAGLARYRRNSGSTENACTRESGTNGGTAAVGTYAPNEWGLYDTHGNVYEWTEDWWAPGTNSEALTDPTGPANGRFKTVRGGSWNAEGTHCRAAARPGSRSLDNASNTFGVRVCASVAAAQDALPAPRATEGAKQPIPFAYVVKSGTITLTQYTGGGGDVEIPDTVDGLPVAAIGDSAFQQCGALARIRFPASIANIGNHAFEHCTHLAAVVFPPDSKLTCIGDWAFHHCLALSDFPFPKGTTVIGERAFSCCFGFTRVEIPARVSSIGEHAFHNCGYIAAFHVDEANPAYCGIDGVLFDKAMKTLIRYPPEKYGSYAVPPGATRIESWAFYKCDGLSRLAIPASATDIIAPSLGTCRNLSAILVDPGNPFFSGADGVLFDKEKTALLAYPGRGPETYEIPAGVKTVGVLAFENCSRLLRVTLPVSVASVEPAAFRRCESLAGLFFKGRPPSLAPEVFAESEQATLYHLSDQPGWNSTFGGRPTKEWKTETGPQP